MLAVVARVRQRSFPAVRALATALVVTTAVAGCQSTPPADGSYAGDESARSGVDLRFADSSVQPAADLFGHVNGGWLAQHPIPPDRAVDGVTVALEDLVEQQLHTLIVDAGDAADGTDERRIADLYASYMDTAAIARRGLQPLLDELAQIDRATDPDALAAVVGGLDRSGVPGGVAVWVEPDAKDSSRNVAIFSQLGLGLPDESYYRDEEYSEILAAYPRHIAQMFAMVYGGSPVDHAATAERVVALESKLAAAHWDVVEDRDVAATYNLRSWADLTAEAPGYDWAGWMRGLGTTPQQATQIVVRQPSYLTAFAAAWVREPLQDWKEWAHWRVISERAPLLTDDLVAANFAFNGTLLSGTETLRDRWKRAVTFVDTLVGEAVGRLYVERHFDAQAKARMDELTVNLRESYRASIETLDWMTPQTRAKALEKLDKIRFKIGHPDRWRDYSTVVVDTADLYGNARRASAAETDWMLAKLGKPVDRDEWITTPQTVNAFYDPASNEIVFPAGFLQPPFFDPDVDDAANYGGVGAVIGHEIGHAFDDQGAEYDGDGNLLDWWTDTDRAEFAKRTDALIEQYNAYVPRQLGIGAHVNGALTLGENIGDLGGLAIALQAYHRSLQGRQAPVIDDLTGTQRVFASYAVTWREKMRDARMMKMLATDPHSPPEFRVNGVVRNIDEFYDAFDVDESDALYLAPEQRVRIWN